MARKKDLQHASEQQPQKRPSQESPERQEPKGGSQEGRHRNKEQAGTSTPHNSVYDVSEIRSQLNMLGLTLRDIPGDGNCLFRALGDQLDGHSHNHMKHRMDTVRYMIAHREHFEPFMDMPFDRYMDNLSRVGTHAGQDALVAFARMHQVNIVIHQLKSPLWQIDGCGGTGGSPVELHLSYHNGEHYSSVRHLGDVGATPAAVRIAYTGTVPCCVSHTTLTSMTSPVNSLLSMSSANTPYLPSTDSTTRAVDDARSLQAGGDVGVIVREAMTRSGCRDETMTGHVLAEHDYDLDQAVDYLISLSSFICPPSTEELEGKEEGRASAEASVRRRSPPVDGQAEANRRRRPRRDEEGRQKRRDLKPNLRLSPPVRLKIDSASGGCDDLPSDLRFLTL